jgi:peroxiredoxin
MPLEPLIYLVLFLAALGFLASSFIFLVWAFLGRRGEPRTRRLRISLSSLLLFVATGLSFFSMMYLVLMPAMSTLRPEFRLPYGWLTSVLSIFAPVLIFASISLVIHDLWRPRGTRKRVLLASLCFLLLFLAVSAADYGLIYSVQVPAFDRYVMIESRDWRTRVGDMAPDFTVAKLDGTQVGLPDLRGKVVLLNFFATWCGPCKSELPHLQELWDEWAENDDFAMLVIGRDESRETVAAFKSENGYTFPMASDPDASQFKKIADDGIPRTYLISRDGRILYQSIGFAEIPIYQRELATLRQSIVEELKATP